MVSAFPRPTPPRHLHRPLAARVRWTPQRLVPGLETLRHYERGWLRGDVVAGVTVAAYLVPQVMAYAQIAGLPAAVGLAAVVGPALAYAVFGTSRRLSAGPESTTALLTATAVGAVVAGDPDRWASLTAALALVVAAVCGVAWLFGLGFLADLLSKPVLVGYLAGAAVLMIVSQIEKLTGIPAPGDSVLEQLEAAVRNAPGHVQPLTVGVSVVLVALLLVGARWWPRAPHPLLTVLVATAATAWFGLEARGLATVGPVPAGLPVPRLPDVVWADVAALLVPALGIAVVAYSDNILTARAFARDGDPAIDDNQEFLALGAANLAAGVVGGFPVSSSGSRTAIASALGARSQGYMLVTAATVLASTWLFADVLALFPQAALGAIVVYAALKLVQVREIRRIVAFRRSEGWLVLATFLGVLTLGILGGIGLAVGLSVAELVRRMARPHDAVLGYAPGLGGMHDVDDHPDARVVPGLVVFRYDAPLCFANAADFVARAVAAVDEAATPTRWLVLNAEANVETDITSLDALADLRRTLADRDVLLGLARVKVDLRRELDRHGVGHEIAAGRMFATLPEAVRAYCVWHRDTTGRLPDGVETLPEESRPAGLE